MGQALNDFEPQFFHILPVFATCNWTDILSFTIQLLVIYTIFLVSTSFYNIYINKSSPKPQTFIYSTTSSRAWLTTGIPHHLHQTPLHHHPGHLDRRHPHFLTLHHLHLILLHHLRSIHTVHHLLCLSTRHLLQVHQDLLHLLPQGLIILRSPLTSLEHTNLNRFS